MRSIVKRLVILTGLLLLLVACQADLLEEAREQIGVGMPREEALEILAEQAWYHQPCYRGSSVDDLFFYGDHHYDRANVVIVRSDMEEGVYRVVQVGSFEPYAWHRAYENCVQREKFEE